MTTSLEWVTSPAADRLEALIELWPVYAASYRTPRSRWLHDFEAILREQFPAATSKQRTLTARNAAPFPLMLPGVP